MGWRDATWCNMSAFCCCSSAWSCWGLGICCCCWGVCCSCWGASAGGVITEDDNDAGTCDGDKERPLLQCDLGPEEGTTLQFGSTFFGQDKYSSSALQACANIHFFFLKQTFKPSDLLGAWIDNHWVRLYRQPKWVDVTKVANTKASALKGLRNLFLNQFYQHAKLQYAKRKLFYRTMFCKLFFFPQLKVLRQRSEQSENDTITSRKKKKGLRTTKQLEECELECRCSLNHQRLPDRLESVIKIYLFI